MQNCSKISTTLENSDRKNQISDAHFEELRNLRWKVFQAEQLLQWLVNVCEMA